MSTSTSNWSRRMTILTVALVVLLCGAVGLGAYMYTSQEGNNVTSLSDGERDHEHTGDEAQPVSFTTANTGTCVTWNPGVHGQPNSDFRIVDCQEPHRFEVASREDLSSYPTSEFGEAAEQPNLERQAQLTSELCTGPTQNYLNGRLDPEGRYSISPILPPPSFWEEGDRTMLCGVMVPDATGRSIETIGLAAQQDQSRVFSSGTCIRTEGDISTEVPCTEDYSWQVTSSVNLAEQFGDTGWPSTDEQNQYLNEVCTNAAREYLGGDDALYYSTLAPFWTTMQQQSWDAGSRTINCALTFGRDGGGFAVLNGDLRTGFTIDGAPPAELPERKPLRR